MGWDCAHLNLACFISKTILILSFFISNEVTFKIHYMEIVYLKSHRRHPNNDIKRNDLVWWSFTHLGGGAYRLPLHWMDKVLNVCLISLCAKFSVWSYPFIKSLNSWTEFDGTVRFTGLNGWPGWYRGENRTGIHFPYNWPTVLYEDHCMVKWFVLNSIIPHKIEMHAGISGFASSSSFFSLLLVSLNGAFTNKNCQKRFLQIAKHKCSQGTGYLVLWIFLVFPPLNENKDMW